MGKQEDDDTRGEAKWDEASKDNRCEPHRDDAEGRKGDENGLSTA